jgi:hypothetical protein
VEGSLLTVLSNESGFRAQVETRPKEKSFGPRICEALRVMNPFESIAGRKTCSSRGALINCARADVPEAAIRVRANASLRKCMRFSE